MTFEKFLAGVHALTHRHVFTAVPAGHLKSCQARLLPGLPDIGFRPDFIITNEEDRGPWYWVPPDMVQKIAMTDSPYTAVALLRARYREMDERLHRP
jgi:hypothetical protein